MERLFEHSKASDLQDPFEEFSKKAALIEEDLKEALRRKPKKAKTDGAGKKQQRPKSPDRRLKVDVATWDLQAAASCESGLKLYEGSGTEGLLVKVLVT